MFETKIGKSFNMPTGCISILIPYLVLRIEHRRIQFCIGGKSLPEIYGYLLADHLRFNGSE